MERGVERGAAVAQAGAGVVVWESAERERAALDADVAVGGEGGAGGEFETLDGGIHEAAGAAAFERRLAEQRPAFVGAADGEGGVAVGVVEQDGETPRKNVAEDFSRQLEAAAAEVAPHFLEVRPEVRGEEEGVVQFVAMIGERRGEGAREQMRGERVPEQRDGGHPRRVRERFHGAKFDEAAAAALGAGVPELVEAGLAAVGVAGGVGVEMTERLADDVTVVAGREVFEKAVGHLEVVKRAGALVGARGLRGGADVLAGEKVGERGMMLPVAEHGDDPRGAGEERVFVEARAAEEQVVAAAGAGLFVGGDLFEGAESGGGAGALQGVEPGGVIAPRRAGREVDFEDAGIGGDAEFRPHVGFVGGDVAGENRRAEPRLVERAGDVPDEREPRLLQERREKDVQRLVADLDGQRAAVRALRQRAERQPQSGVTFGPQQLDAFTERPVLGEETARLVIEREHAHGALFVERIKAANPAGREAETMEEVFGKARQRGGVEPGAWARDRQGERGDERGAVAVPDEIDRPARVDFAGVELPRREDGHSVRERLREERVGERVAVAELRGAERGDAPFGALRIERHVGRLAAEGEAHAVGGKGGVHGVGDAGEVFGEFHGIWRLGEWAIWRLD